MIKVSPERMCRGECDCRPCWHLPLKIEYCESKLRWWERIKYRKRERRKERE